ncbi:RNA-directed DNA polymerase from mobile element jockey-like, partial [Brachionus plicatilis]
MVCKQVKSAVRQSIRKFEESIVRACKSQPKLLFNYINSQKQCKDTIKGLLDKEGAFCTDGGTIANLLNAHFGSVFISRLSSHAPSVQSFASPQREVNVVCFSPANVCKYVMRLNPRKSPGMDGINEVSWVNPPVPASSLSQPGPAGAIRGHARRFSGQASTKCLQRANTFTNRIVNEWNALPAT